MAPRHTAEKLKLATDVLATYSIQPRAPYGSSIFPHTEYVLDRYLLRGVEPMGHRRQHPLAPTKRSSLFRSKSTDLGCQVLSPCWSHSGTRLRSGYDMALHTVGSPFELEVDRWRLQNPVLDGYLVLDYGSSLNLFSPNSENINGARVIIRTSIWRAV